MNDAQPPSYKAPDMSLAFDEHVRVYRETNGEIGYEWNGVSILLLTTTGRRSGNERTSALIFGRHGDDFLVVASKGGDPAHPDWYLNLLANPTVEIQVKDQIMSATARTASDDERAGLWAIMVELWPNYDVYASRTTRPIPVVVLTPVT